ncbi:MAG: ABC transporter ATP-binding protein [Peptostreptococcaceae bacterium]
MLKISRYFKPFIGYILAVICLLIVQASADLSLPDYTSNIINIGIQQNGIENATPNYITKNSLDNIKLFLDEDEIKILDENFNLIESDENFSSEVLENGVYKLNTEDKDIIETLNSIVSKPQMIINAIQISESDEMPIKSVDELNLIPTEYLNVALAEIEKNFDGMSEDIISQAAIPFVKSEYEVLGIDVNKMQRDYVFNSGLKMLGVSLISMMSTISIGYLAAQVAAGIGRNLRKDVFEKVMSFSNYEFDKFQTASLITRSTNDINQIQTVLVMMIRMVFYAPIIATGAFIKVIQINSSMAWIIALAITLMTIIVSILFKFALPKFEIIQNLVDKLNLVSREILNGILVVRAFNTNKKEEERFDKVNGEIRDTSIFINRVMTIMQPSMMLIMNLSTLLIVWVGANQINLGTLQVGDMMAFIQYTMQIIMAFLFITMLTVMIPRASVSANRINDVLTTECLIKDPTDTVKLNDSKGVIEFKNVSFKYDNADNNILENINFTAKPGDVTAFIGSTGSGKSTLINLIPRFYDVTSGEILIDGIDIRNMKQSEVRKEIGYVPQKGVLFSGTIKSNISFSNENLSMEKVIESADISKSLEFIEKKEEKFDSEISQGGTNVSGGQKQRLSIARALAKNPNIYIFDDSFSALDLKTDSSIRQELKKHTKDKTVLIVAQRISTIMNAEQIIVLDEGKIVGMGTHKDLLKNCEVYNQIASSQLSKEEL